MKPQKRGAARTRPAGELEMVERKVVAMRIIATGAPKVVVRNELQRLHKLTPAQADNVIRAVSQDLAAEYDNQQQFARAETAHRLRRNLARAYNESRLEEEMVDGKKVRRTSKEQLEWLKAALDIETQLARVEGTTAPIRVELQVQPMSTIIAGYMSTLTDSDIQELYEEGVRTKAAAAALPPPSPPAQEQH